MAGYPLGAGCYSSATMGNVVSPRAVEETAAEWWAVVNAEDRKRHDWILSREREATERLERQILRQNKKMLPGDYAISRLGETAHRKGIVADCMQSEALEQHTELRAELRRTPGERMLNWNHFGRQDRQDWIEHHQRRTHHRHGMNVGLTHNQLDPQASAACEAGKSIEAYESAVQARIETSSMQHALDTFCNRNCVGQRPAEGFYKHIRKPYVD